MYIRKNVRDLRSGEGIFIPEVLKWNNKGTILIWLRYETQYLSSLRPTQNQP
jgi:hypothetical protein